MSARPRCTYVASTKVSTTTAAKMYLSLTGTSNSKSDEEENDDGGGGGGETKAFVRLNVVDVTLSRPRAFGFAEACKLMMKMDGCMSLVKACTSDA